MRWLMLLIHPSRRSVTVPAQVIREVERAEQDWERVRAAAEQSRNLRSANGFVDALTRAQRPRR